MALVDIGGNIPYPGPPVGMAGAPTFANLSTDAANEKAAFVFQAPKTGSIDRIGFKTATVTTGGVSWDIRLETVNTSTGFPTGTLVGTDTNVGKTIASTDDNTWFEVTLTSAASVIEGGYYAIVIAAPSSGSFNANFSYFADGFGGGFPCALLYTTSWALSASGAPQFSVRYTDGTYPPISGVFPIVGSTTNVYNSTSTPNVYGNKIIMPFKCKIDGFWIWGDFDGDYMVNLYDSNGATVLVSGSGYAAIPATTSTSFNYGKFLTSYTLEKNTLYILGVAPSSASNVSIYSYDFYLSGVRNQYKQGSGIFLSTAKDPTGIANWTDNYSGILALGLMVNQLDDGTPAASSGSAYTYGFMT